MLKWYGHVLSREDEYVGKRVVVMEVPGKRRRGRPKRRWLGSIRNDLSERELSREDTQDRANCTRLVRPIDPHIQVGKDVEEEEVLPYAISKYVSEQAFCGRFVTSDRLQNWMLSVN